MIWLLPGMDASGLLWAPLLDAIGSRAPVRAIDYPLELATYDEAIEHAGVPDAPVVLAAESFSGPVAIRIAHAHPDRVRALVLIASFARGPRALPEALLRTIFAVHPPAIAIRALMVGGDAPDALVALVRTAIARVPARTMARRVVAAARADVRAELAALQAPVTWAHATRDRMFSARATREAIAARPDLDVRGIDGPHLLAQARPREIAELVLGASSDRS